MKCIQINVYIHDYARICMCIHIYRNLYMNICVHTWHVYKYNKYNKHNKYNRSPKHEFWRGVSPRITFFSRGKWQKRSFSTNRDIFLWKKTHLVERNVLVLLGFHKVSDQRVLFLQKETCFYETRHNEFKGNCLWLPCFQMVKDKRDLFLQNLFLQKETNVVNDQRDRFLPKRKVSTADCR